MSILIPTRYFDERPEPPNGLHRAVLGAAAILTMKVSMLWAALQAI